MSRAGVELRGMEYEEVKWRWVSCNDKGEKSKCFRVGLSRVELELS